MVIEASLCIFDVYNLLYFQQPKICYICNQSYQMVWKKSWHWSFSVWFFWVYILQWKSLIRIIKQNSTINFEFKVATAQRNGANNKIW